MSNARALVASPRVPFSVLLTMTAVLVAGTTAAVKISPVLFLTTFVVLAMIARGAHLARIARSAAVELDDLPASLQSVVARTIEELPDAEPRRLLLNVLAQARPLFASRTATLDARQEDLTRENVRALVEACCVTALELSRLDVASAANDSAGSEMVRQAATARALLAGRLSHAATALASLYVAGIERGSQASDRVVELVDEINADASARRAATSEMESLLRAR